MKESSQIIDANKYYITGIGAVTPYGNGVDVFAQGLASGKHAISKITGELSELLSYSGQIPEEVFNAIEEKYKSKRVANYIMLGLASSAEAVEIAGLTNDPSIDKSRVGVISASGANGIEVKDKVIVDGYQRSVEGKNGFSPAYLSKGMPNALASYVGVEHGFSGTNFSVDTACSSSGVAMYSAINDLRPQRDINQPSRNDIMIVVGSDMYNTKSGYGPFLRAKAMFKGDDLSGYRHFDKDSGGFVPGAGAGSIVIETGHSILRRGVTALAEVSVPNLVLDLEAKSSYFLGNTGKYGIESMRGGIKNIGLTPEKIDSVSCHATGTAGDSIEAKMVDGVFGPHKPTVQAIKSSIGHLLGAAGAVQLVAAVNSIQDQVAYPIGNHYNKRDGFPDINMVLNKSRPQNIEAILVNQFGFHRHLNSFVIQRVREKGENS